MGRANGTGVEERLKRTIYTTMHTGSEESVFLPLLSFFKKNITKDLKTYLTINFS